MTARHRRPKPIETLVAIENCERITTTEIDQSLPAEITGNSHLVTQMGNETNILVAPAPVLIKISDESLVETQLDAATHVKSSKLCFHF